VEETSFRSKAIEGVSTSTAGFIGPARFGPVNNVSGIITSLTEFERTYGSSQNLQFTGGEIENFLWHGVRAFFEEGGKRLCLVRAFQPRSPTDDGCARGSLPGGSSSLNEIHLQARFPGAEGNLRVSFTLRLGPNILARETKLERGLKVAVNAVKSLQPGDVVWISNASAQNKTPFAAGDFYSAKFNAARKTWSFQPSSGRAISFTTLRLDLGQSIRILTLGIRTELPDAGGRAHIWNDLPLDPGHQRNGVPDSFITTFTPKPGNDAAPPLVITPGRSLTNGLKVLTALFAAKPDWKARLENLKSTDKQRTCSLFLAGGNDGSRPGPAEYAGQANETAGFKSGLRAFDDIDGISIVAAPGSTFGYERDFTAQAIAINRLLIAHAEHMRCCIAVLDSGDGQSIEQIRTMRAQFSSSHAALYYPWIRVLNPRTGQEIVLPPGGFVCGIYARNDVNRGVHKAPANEVVNLAMGLEQTINKAQQDVLNLEGINCFRFFAGRGFRLWGARTLSSDPEWKYVNVRRYFACLEHSIVRGTQWAVFEPNGELLWSNVRRTVEDFLLNEWQSGALLGDKPQDAFFVKCDRSTMTQNDLDNGRLVCLLGVAAVRPAEFIILRISQWTADRKS